MKRVRTVLFGLGAVNRGLLKILLEKKEEIVKRYHCEFIIVGVADSSGVAYHSGGYPYSKLLDLKPSGKKVSSLNGFREDLNMISRMDEMEAEVLIEGSPGNIHSGEPGLSVSQKALSKKWSVVLANKTPLLFAWNELHNLARQNQCGIKFSATVCGGLPVINVLQRDLKGARLKNLQGIFNATTNYVLQELQRGGTMEAAIKEAQRIGAAEADPSYDINGYDTANKLFIIMKSFTDFNGTIQDIKVQGIQALSREEILEAERRGNTIKLVASAEIIQDNWKLSVAPSRVLAQSFLGSCNGWEMGIELETDLYESIRMKNYEADPLGTAAAVLRDAIDLI